MAKNSKYKTKPLFFILTLIFGWIFFIPAHAYAGPGIAIASVVVAFTILIAFIASLLIRIKMIIKFLIKKIRFLYRKNIRKNKKRR